MIADSRERMTAIYLVQTASENSLSSMADSQPTICNNDKRQDGEFQVLAIKISDRLTGYADLKKSISYYPNACYGRVAPLRPSRFIPVSMD